MKLHLSLILCVSLVSGCSHPMPVQTSSYIQESLLQPCEKDTPIPKDGTGGEVLKALEDWQTVYNQCASSKDKLIIAIKHDNQ